jgi:hypothetical protein
LKQIARTSLNKTRVKLAGWRKNHPAFSGEAMKLFQLSMLDQDEKPNGVPMDCWKEFVRVCDEVRKSGMERWSARAAIEIIRYENVIKQGNRDFKINNVWQKDLSRAYLKMRKCYTFFECRNHHETSGL